MKNNIQKLFFFYTVFFIQICFSTNRIIDKMKDKKGLQEEIDQIADRLSALQKNRENLPNRNIIGNIPLPVVPPYPIPITRIQRRRPPLPGSDRIHMECRACEKRIERNNQTMENLDKLITSSQEVMKYFLLSMEKIHGKRCFLNDLTDIIVNYYVKNNYIFCVFDK